MKNRHLVLIFRIGAGFVLAIHALVSLGLLLQGLMTVRGAIISSDYGYGAVLAFLGFIFLLMTWDGWRRVRDASFIRKVSEWREGIGIRKTGVTAGIFLLLFLLRNHLHSMILYIGFAAGAFFVHSASLTYTRFSGVDLFGTGIHHFAWVYQWHFVDHVVRMVWGFIARRRKKKQARKPKSKIY